MRLLDHMVALLLISEGPLYYLHTSIYQFTFPQRVYKNSFFSISSPAFLISSTFSFSPSCIWWFWCHDLHLFILYIHEYIIVVVIQSPSCVQLSETLWTAAHQASLSFAISLFKLKSIDSVMLSNHLILCHPLLLLPSLSPRMRVFSSESALHITRPSIRASVLVSVLPVNVQGWCPLGLTSLISLLSKRL